MMPKDYIVVHATSACPDRWYHRWSEVDWMGMRVYSVGFPDDNKKNSMTIPIYHGNFHEVARLLRGSLGLVCVDSAVMNLAKSLRVLSLTIYPSKSQLLSAPHYGRSLVNPTPDEIRSTILEMFFTPAGLP
jgi:hypothetical protein